MDAPRHERNQHLVKRQVRLECQSHRPGSPRSLTLCYHVADESSLSEITNSPVGSVGLSLVQIGPSKETTSPVSFTRLMIGDELIVIDRPISFVQSVGSSSSTVIG